MCTCTLPTFIMQVCQFYCWGGVDAIFHTGSATALQRFTTFSSFAYYTYCTGRNNTITMSHCAVFVLYLYHSTALYSNSYTSHKYLDLHTSWQVFHNNLYKLLTKLIELSAFSIINYCCRCLQVCGRCSFLGISRMFLCWHKIISMSIGLLLLLKTS